jgi:hypothetical protein
MSLLDTPNRHSSVESKVTGKNSRSVLELKVKALDGVTRKIGICENAIQIRALFFKVFLYSLINPRENLLCAAPGGAISTGPCTDGMPVP